MMFNDTIDEAARGWLDARRAVESAKEWLESAKKLKDATIEKQTARLVLHSLSALGFSKATDSPGEAVNPYAAMLGELDAAARELSLAERCFDAATKAERKAFSAFVDLVVSHCGRNAQAAGVHDRR